MEVRVFSTAPSSEKTLLTTAGPCWPQEFVARVPRIRGGRRPRQSRWGICRLAEDLRNNALEYHRFPTPGSWRSSPPSRWPTSATWRWPIRRASPPPARRSSPTRPRPRTVTARGNLVAVITNGTAVLGLGAIGPLAAKPVMEGKARPVQEVRRHRRLRHRDRRDATRTSWSTSSPRWSRPSAASTSRTSRRRNASRSSASCASG